MMSTVAWGTLSVSVIYLFIRLSRYYCIFYCFINWPVMLYLFYLFWLCYFIYLFLFYVLYLFYFIYFIYLLYFILSTLFILFYLCIHLCYLLLFYLLFIIYFYLSVCGAVNVRVWMPRIHYCILNECECVAIYIFIFNVRIAHTARAPPGLLFLWPRICDIPGEQRYNCDDVPPRPANRGGTIIVICPGWGACPPAFSCNAHAGGACVPRNKTI